MEPAAAAGVASLVVGGSPPSGATGGESSHSVCFDAGGDSVRTGRDGGLRGAGCVELEAGGGLREEYFHGIIRL